VDACKGWQGYRILLDRHMAYLALKEDSLNNNGLYRASRLFRIGEFKEKGLREVLEKEGGGGNSREGSIPARHTCQ